MIINVLFLLLMGSCQNYNSNTTDRTRYGTQTLEDNPRFVRAYAIIQSRCTNCHTSAIHAGWASYTTSAKWVASGASRVVAGQPQSSQLILRTINSGETQSDMPQGGSPLPNDEYDALREWIENIP